MAQLCHCSDSWVGRREACAQGSVGYFDVDGRYKYVIS